MVNRSSPPFRMFAAWAILLSVVLPTGRATPMPSSTPTNLPTTSPSAPPTDAATFSPSTGATLVPSSSPPTQKPSHLLSSMPSFSPSVGTSEMPSGVFSATPSVRPSTHPSEAITAKPSSSPTYSYSIAPSISPSAAPTTPRPTVAPSSLSTTSPSAPPTDAATFSPSTGATLVPSSSPPTQKPSHLLSSMPSFSPSVGTSEMPSGVFSATPSLRPSTHPSEAITAKPSSSPTYSHSIAPSISPSAAPTTPRPTVAPSSLSTTSPSAPPTDAATFSPSTGETLVPSSSPPTQKPSHLLSSMPSFSPSVGTSERPSKHPVAAPSATSSLKPSLKTSHSPSPFPSKESNKFPSQAPAHAYVDVPSSKPSEIPSSLHYSEPPSKQVVQPPSSSSNVSPKPVSARIFIEFPGLRAGMDVNEVKTFEEIGTHFLRDILNGSISILDSKVLGQEVVVDRNEAVESALVVELRVIGQERHNDAGSYAFDLVVADVFEENMIAFWDALAEKAPLFVLAEPLIENRGIENKKRDKMKQKRVGGAVGGGFLFVVFIFAVFVYRRRVRNSLEMHDIGSSHSSQSSVAAMTLSPEKQIASETILGAPESFAPAAVSNQSNDSFTFSELYAASSVASDSSTKSYNAIIEDRGLPDSISRELYPIISMGDSGESRDDVESCNVSNCSKSVQNPTKQDTVKDLSATELTFARENLLKYKKVGGTMPDEDKFVSARRSIGAKTIFSCFAPCAEGEVLENEDENKACTRVTSMGSRTSIDGPREMYEIRAPQGNLGMVVVTTRDGPKVCHLKQDSPLSGVVDEGDIICSVDDKNTRSMTATSLRRFLRNSESSNERVIQVLGRRAEAHSSGDESL